MSYEAKKPEVMAQQLKVQELCVRSTDKQIYDANGGNGRFTIGEELEAVLLVVQKDDSANALVHFDAADITLDGEAFEVAALALAANDVAIIKYIVKQ